MKVILDIDDIHEAVEVASFCGGFLATNDGKACITPVLKAMFAQIILELPEKEKKKIEADLQKLIGKKEAILRMGKIMIEKKSQELLPASKLETTT